MSIKSLYDMNKVSVHNKLKYYKCQNHKPRLMATDLFKIRVTISQDTEINSDFSHSIKRDILDNYICYGY